MDAKIKEYIELQNRIGEAYVEHNKLEQAAHDYHLFACGLELEAERLEKEIIAEMESDGCLTADYDTGDIKLTRIALTVRKQSPKPQSPDAVPDDYIVTKEVKSINQAKIKADFNDAEVLPNWLKREGDVKSLQIRYVNKK
jgi:hypothetical protein